MKATNWFDRTFDFSFDENIFPATYERLVGTPLRLENKIKQIHPDFLLIKDNGKWSIQEHVGHLLDLEPLWLGRVHDILKAKEVMRPADLTNRKTYEAKHNEVSIELILDQFRTSRNQLIEALDALSDTEILMSANHPRLDQPMRIMDLCLFVAEHDDHHLAKITELNRALEH